MAAEPRVLTSDVRELLRRVIDPDDGASVRQVAERASTSTRTVYRVLGCQKDTLDLGLADRLVLAVGAHLSDVHLVLEDGRVVDYADA